MEVQTEVLQAFSDFIGVSIGQLPEKGGAAMELSPSSALRRFFNGESYESMSVLVLAKYKSQKTALDKLNQICNKLSGRGHIAIREGEPLPQAAGAEIPFQIKPKFFRLLP